MVSIFCIWVFVFCIFNKDLQMIQIIRVTWYYIISDVNHIHAGLHLDCKLPWDGPHTIRNPGSPQLQALQKNQGICACYFWNMYLYVCICHCVFGRALIPFAILAVLNFRLYRKIKVFLYLSLCICKSYHSPHLRLTILIIDLTSSYTIKNNNHFKCSSNC